MTSLRYFSMFSGIGGFELGIQRASNQQPTQIEQDGQWRNGNTDEVGHNVLLTSRTAPLCVSNKWCKHCGKYGVKCECYKECDCILVEDATDTNTRPSKSKLKINGRFGEHATCIGYSEIDKYAIKVYERQFSEHTNYGDATKIVASELPDFDLLVGGFPCQAFSIAGKRAGFKDTRGTLFFDIARILKEKQPRHLVLENVKGLLSHDSGRTFTTIIGVLTDLGYLVEWQVLNSKDFGVPQNRERVYIVGHLGNECGRKVFPISGTNGQVIEQLNRPTHSNDRIYGTGGVSPTLNTMQGGLRQPFISGGLQKNAGLMHEQSTALTKAMGEGGGHTPILNAIRRLTPKECERLQGFPDNWTAGESDTQRYKMCGNAVTVNTVQAVMERLMKCL